MGLSSPLHNACLKTNTKRDRDEQGVGCRMIEVLWGYRVRLPAQTLRTLSADCESRKVTRDECGAVADVGWFCSKRAPRHVFDKGPLSSLHRVGVETQVNTCALDMSFLHISGLTRDEHGAGCRMILLIFSSKFCFWHVLSIPPQNFLGQIVKRKRNQQDVGCLLIEFNVAFLTRTHHALVIIELRQMNMNKSLVPCMMADDLLHSSSKFVFMTKARRVLTTNPVKAKTPEMSVVSAAGWFQSKRDQTCIFDKGSQYLLYIMYLGTDKKLSKI